MSTSCTRLLTIDVKAPPISIPRRCLLNERVTNSVGKVFDNLKRQPLSSVTVGSRFFRQRAFADAAIVWQQLPIFGQDIFDNRIQRYPIPQPLEDEHPESNGCRIDGSRAGGGQPLKFFVRNDLPQQINGSSEFRFGKWSLIVRHNFRPVRKAAKLQYLSSWRKYCTKQSIH